MKRMIFVICLVVLTQAARAGACTIFVGVGESTVLVGNNLDAGNYFPRLWIVPASEGQYARLCFGTDKAFKIAEGGMNDQGLYISVNALDEDTGWKADRNLPDWEEWSGWYVRGVPDGILAKCATVEEAIEIFRSYNLFTLAKVKFLVADRSGASVVIEWSGGALRFLKRTDATYQISTNFVQSDFAPDEIPCQRYLIADRMLGAAAGRYSVEGFREVLSATHLEFQTPTIYSNVCDLTTGDVYIYYFHYFEEVVRINIHDAANEGRVEHMVRDLFEVTPYAASVYEDFGRKQ